MIAMEACAPLDVLCGIGNVATGAADSAMANVAEDIAESFGKIMASLGTFWIYIPTPNLAGGAGSSSDVVGFVQNSLVYYVAIAAIISIMITSIRIILTQRGEGFRKIASGIVTLVLVTGLAIPLLSVVIIASDEFSVWIVNLATDGSDFGATLGIATSLTALTAPAGPIIVIILGIVAICISLLQVVLMLFRMAMLVLLAGMLPLAASFASTDAGKDWLKKYSGWLIAFVLYKPVAAIIYSVAFALVANGVFSYENGELDVVGQDILTVLAGLILMAVAVVALGALMKFVTPMVGAIGGGGAGGALAAGVGAAASGAVSVMSMKNSSGGAPPSPSAAASTPKGAAPSGGAAAGQTGAAAAGAGASTAGAGASAAGAGATAGGAGAAVGGAGAGAAAGSAGGPIGAGAGLVAGAALQGASAAGSAAKRTTEQAIEGGPDGSN